MKNSGITFYKLIAILVVLCGTFFNNVQATEARITYIQHDGFIIQSDNKTFYVDMTIKPNDTLPSPDVILITHNHADHFVKLMVIDLATTSGAYVVGPQPVISALNGFLPGTQLISFAPPTGTKMTDSILGVNLTIYGSYDGTNQNSYRLEFPSGIVIYINGDMPGDVFETFVTNGCTELLNMNIAMLDSWAYTMSDFYANYDPDVMIKMHMWSAPCVVYADYPSSFDLTTENTYIYGFTAITENPNPKNEIKIFPIPAKNNLIIATNSTAKQSLEIYNMAGQAVYTSDFLANASIDISTFPTGVYIVKLNSDKETLVKKFVKE